MEQKVFECKDCIRRIKRKLEDNGYNILKVDDNILCKTPKVLTQNNTEVITYASSRTVTGTTCPVNMNGCIHPNKTSCTYTGNCTVDSSKCPIHGNNNNNNSDNSGSSSNTGNNTSGINNNSECLFRIMPTDIYNGVFLHAIILRGEHCDLKMTFIYDEDNTVKDVIDVINFLVG